MFGHGYAPITWTKCILGCFYDLSICLFVPEITISKWSIICVPFLFPNLESHSVLTILSGGVCLTLECVRLTAGAFPRVYFGLLWRCRLGVLLLFFSWPWRVFIPHLAQKGIVSLYLFRVLVLTNEWSTLPEKVQSAERRYKKGSPFKWRSSLRF